MKCCTRCGETKPEDLFGLDGEIRRNQCKSCRAKYKRNRRQNFETAEARERRLSVAREYQRNNHDSILQKQIEWRDKNSAYLKAYHKTNYQSKAEVVKARTKKWRLENSARKRAYNKAWAAENRVKTNGYYSKSKRKRRTSSQVRLYESISEQIRNSIRRCKNNRRWESLVDFTRDEIVSHLERQFVKGMSWDNYGDWHIDHIVPASAFKYETPTDANFKACWALTNLRPLWARENIQKRDSRTHLL